MSQQKILDSLAAGESRLAIEVAVHENSCEACRPVPCRTAPFVSFPRDRATFACQCAGSRVTPSRCARPNGAKTLVSRYAAIPRLEFCCRRCCRDPGCECRIRFAPCRESLTSAANYFRPLLRKPPRNPETSTTPLRESPTLFTPPASTRVIRARPSPPDPQVIVSTEERQAYAEFVAEHPSRKQTHWR